MKIEGQGFSITAGEYTNLDGETRRITTLHLEIPGGKLSDEMKGYLGQWNIVPEHKEWYEEDDVSAIVYDNQGGGHIVGTMRIPDNTLRIKSRQPKTLLEAVEFAMKIASEQRLDIFSTQIASVDLHFTPSVEPTFYPAG